jgi:hypothetical protein
MVDGSTASNVLLVPLLSGERQVPPRSCPSAKPSALPPLEQTTPSLPIREMDTDDPKSTSAEFGEMVGIERGHHDAAEVLLPFESGSTTCRWRADAG